MRRAWINETAQVEISPTPCFYVIANFVAAFSTYLSSGGYNILVPNTEVLSRPMMRQGQPNMLRSQ